MLETEPSTLTSSPKSRQQKACSIVLHANTSTPSAAEVLIVSPVSEARRPGKHSDDLSEFCSMNRDDDNKKDAERLLSLQPNILQGKGPGHTCHPLFCICHICIEVLRERGTFTTVP